MKKNKVLFFRAFINFVINHARIFLGFIILLAVCLLSPLTYRAVKDFIDLYNIPVSDFQGNLITALLTSALPILYAWISGFYKSWKHIIIKIKRTLYRYCHQLSISATTPVFYKKIATLIIRVFYYQKREPLQEQQIVVNKILDELNSHVACKKSERIFWIQGSPYSGKTTTILNLFMDIISNIEYNDLFEQLDGKIVYFDLGRDDFSLPRLLDTYKIGKYENHLLVLDNLHKMSSADCFEVIKQVVLNIQAFAIIVLLRKPSDFLCDNNQIVKLNKIIQSVGVPYYLPTVSKDDFTAYRENAFSHFCNQFYLTDLDYRNDAIIVHLSSLYVRRNSDLHKIIPKLQTFLYGEDSSEEIHKKLTAIVSVSLFTGSFSVEVLQRCYGSINYNWNPFLNRLLDIGFLVRYPDSSKKYYYFHEKIAKFYFDRNFTMPFYKNLYLEFFTKLKDYYADIQNEPLTFLYSILLADGNSYRYFFDKIVINANFVNLYEEMNFLLNQDESRRLNYYRELGVLCDRIGELQEAKDYYFKYLNQVKSPDALYKLVQIDHEYIDDYPDIVQKALTSDDCYYVLLGQYWEQHVRMHDGLFNFFDFKKIVQAGQVQYQQVLQKHPYDGIHLLRRIYFDLFRIYYLCGVLEPIQIEFAVSDNSHLKRILSLMLDEFEAYYIKFAVAQFLAQDLLFSLAFLNKRINRSEYNLMLKNHTNLKFEEMSNPQEIATETVRLYNIAIEMLERIGDKTAIFIRYHLYDTKLILINDGDYSQCEQFYEEYMGFATRENDVEYQSYAELFKLKMLLVKMSSPVVIGFEPNYNDLINQACKKISLTRAYQKLCNTRKGNAYAKLRLDLYESIFFFISQKNDSQQFKKQILDIRKQAEKYKYKRELCVIDYIEACQFNPSRENLRIIITYYPIITQ